MSREYDFEQVKKDIEYLLSFSPEGDPSKVPEGLMPMFYFTGTHEGDVEVAERIEQICARYNIDKNDQGEDTDNENGE